MADSLRHRCEAADECGTEERAISGGGLAYGPAIGEIWYDIGLNVWIVGSGGFSNGEYQSIIHYCPFCGQLLPVLGDAQCQ